MKRLGARIEPRFWATVKQMTGKETDQGAILYIIRAWYQIEVNRRFKKSIEKRSKKK